MRLRRPLPAVQGDTLHIVGVGDNRIGKDPSGIQTLLRGVDKNDLAVSLKGASETIRDLFFSNMSERQGKILREDMDAMGPVRLRDVDEAQTGMVVRAKELADTGEIIIVDEAGADELVY